MQIIGLSRVVPLLRLFLRLYPSDYHQTHYLGDESRYNYISSGDFHTNTFLAIEI